MNAIEKLKQTHPGLAEQLKGYAKPTSPDSVYISDTNNEAYDSGLAIWLLENYKYDNMGCGFVAYLNKENDSPMPYLGTSK